ncbi:hydantoinase/oxoprolinase family protein [bacterium CPR1]|nr:hydantoinase/oxoprolinase family protein [bacterium CPR1]
MSFRLGIDVGGTFTDFHLQRVGRPPLLHKILTTPSDPSEGVIAGLAEIAARLEPACSLSELLASVELIVHGTTVTTNAVLTGQGARTALLTTHGFRDALEMRRGLREERYNNRSTNAPPVIPRCLRLPIDERVDAQGQVVRSLREEQVSRAVAFCRDQGVEALAICFLNAFANPQHERAAGEVVRREFPEAYLTVSTELLPSIRFFNRVSTTALNAFVGPKLKGYLDGLSRRLYEAGFEGLLLIMQSNGGVVSPRVAREKGALTLLSGPAAGPIAGLQYARSVGRSSCTVVDMGGTSFDASLVLDSPMLINEGDINRLRIALPMLGIHTIGAGGGSIAHVDAGGLLRVGPQSAGAEPGPACYGRGGRLPTSTDANLILGYLDPDFFAGGRLRLDVAAARQALEENLTRQLGLDVEQAAAGVYRVIGTEMAQGVREVTLERGFDPREFPMVVAGGAGPLHACLIASELEIPWFLVPRSSSVLCAAGMLMSDLKHDHVKSLVMPWDEERIDWQRLEELLGEMLAEGEALLEQERVPADRRSHVLTLDCRYVRQYHEVSFEVPIETLGQRDARSVARAFHREHNRLYGYSNEEQATGIELINLRLTSIGRAERAGLPCEKSPPGGVDAALKGRRRVYLPDGQAGCFSEIAVYDGHRLGAGHRISGPALVERVDTTLFLTTPFDALCDRHGTLVIHLKGRDDLLRDVSLQELAGQAGGLA